MNTLSVIEDWYRQQCNGEWEHSYGIKIETIDNPGWYVAIDLIDTNLAGMNVELAENRNTDTDWYVYKTENNQFVGSGDSSKLNFLLSRFYEIVREKSA